MWPTIANASHEGWSQFLSDQRRGKSSAFLWWQGTLHNATLCKDFSSPPPLPHPTPIVLFVVGWVNGHLGYSRTFYSPNTVSSISFSWTPNIFSARHVITPSSSNRTFFTSNLLSVILTRLLFPWVLLRIDQVILGCGLPDAEMLRVRLPPSFMKINGGGFLVNLGGAVDMINHIKSITTSCTNISNFFSCENGI